MPDGNGKFDPSAHLTDIQGKDYLEVKWRLAWLRSEQPNAFLETALVDREDGFALFKATVTLPDGGSATGYGAETVSDFGDFIEKAETKAIGRALAALGFGTQFCEDFAEGGSVTDAPVARTAPTQRPPARTATATTRGKVMPLRFAGDCADCGYRIPQGTTAIYDVSTKTVRHQEGECVPGGGAQHTDMQ